MRAGDRGSDGAKTGAKTGARMSDTDSFIDEVTEEVRRDQLYGYLRKYGWIAVVVIVAIVGGAAWNEYRKSQAQSAAQAMGDALIGALEANDAAGRAEALAQVTPSTPGNAAVHQMLLSAAQANSDQTDAAVAGLNRIAADGELPAIYRDIAAFKKAGGRIQKIPRGVTGYATLAARRRK